MPGVTRRSRVGALVGALALSTSTLMVPAPAQAAELGCSRENNEPGEAEQDTKGTSPVADLLRLDEVHRLATGDGIGVAVIDTGVQQSEWLTVADGHRLGGEPKVEDGHGTIVAGLIAGQDTTSGIAPGADIVSIKVDDQGPSDSTSDDDEGRASPEDVTAAIRWAIQNRGQFNIRVINISIGFTGPSQSMADAIRDATDQGILVVAAAGNRVEQTDAEDEESEGPEPAPDEVLFPATMDVVLAVTSLDANQAMTSESMLVGPEIDVSAPSVGAWSMMLGRYQCVIDEPASSWAAAEVSGVAALMFQRFAAAKITPAQVKTRIEYTATGGYRDHALDGHGTIQPLEALTASLQVNRQGDVIDSKSYYEPPAKAEAPPPRKDAYETAREDFVWWGLGAGGALVLVLLLRPLLVRRTSR